MKPFRGRFWKVFEAPGVEPFYDNKAHAIDYAMQRTTGLKGELRIYDSNGVLEEIRRF